MDDPSVECPRGHRSAWVTLCKSCLVDVTKGTLQQALDAELLRAALAASDSERKRLTAEVEEMKTHADRVLSLYMKGCERQIALRAALELLYDHHCGGMCRLDHDPRDGEGQRSAH